MWKIIKFAPVILLNKNVLMAFYYKDGGYVGGCSAQIIGTICAFALLFIAPGLFQVIPFSLIFFIIILIILILYIGGSYVEYKENSWKRNIKKCIKERLEFTPTVLEIDDTKLIKIDEVQINRYLVHISYYYEGKVTNYHKYMYFYEDNIIYVHTAYFSENFRFYSARFETIKEKPELKNDEEREIEYIRQAYNTFINR